MSIGSNPSNSALAGVDGDTSKSRLVSWEILLSPFLRSSLSLFVLFRYPWSHEVSIRWDSQVSRYDLHESLQTHLSQMDLRTTDRSRTTRETRDNAMIRSNTVRRRFSWQRKKKIKTHLIKELLTLSFPVLHLRGTTRHLAASLV